MRICAIPGCEKKHYGSDLCGMHYMRQRRYGSPAITMKAGNGDTKKWLDEVALPWESDQCLEYPFGVGGHGYGQTTADGEKILAHVYICTQANGPKPTPDHEAAHSCGNTICVNRRHIRWDTRSGNMQDKLAHGTHNRGERHSLAMLSEQDVLAIRSAVGRQQDIADQYGIAQQTVSDIKSKRRWAWL